MYLVYSKSAPSLPEGYSGTGSSTDRSSPSAMHNSLVILLHRPFVADGHLYSTSPSISVVSFMKCASAASNISNLLRAYHRAFSIRRAPYLISYATYVAATILTRIAARRRNDSTAHSNLATCLAVFEENQETNSAVRKAAKIVHSLMKKLGVVIDNVSLEALEMHPPIRMSERDPQSNAFVHVNRDYQTGAADEANNDAPIGNMTEPANTITHNPLVPSPGSDWVDIDGIIQSFLQENSDRGARLADYDPDGIPVQLSRTPWLPPQQGNPPPPVPINNVLAFENQVPFRPGIEGPNGPQSETAARTYQQQRGARPTSYESVLLDDPLFGFNGSSMDSFPFTEC